MTTFSRPVSRRALLSGTAAMAALGLAGCSQTGRERVARYTEEPSRRPAQIVDPSFSSPAVAYGALADAGFVIPAVPYQKIDRRYYRQLVPNVTGEAPGTIVVDTGNHFLYLTREDGMAMRYGVGLGRAGFEWAGKGYIESKQTWPKWFPPDEMIDRQPELEKYRASYDKANDTWLGGMDGGLDNPLGARALYIYKDGKDTLYRIHGSPEWWSIGKSVSSGCVRLINQDIVDLYSRVPEKTPVLVTGALPAVA